MGVSLFCSELYRISLEIISKMTNLEFFRPQDFNEDISRFLSRQEWSAQAKIIGPVAVVIGFIMLIIGLTFCCLGWKVSRAEQKRMYSTSPNTTMSNVSLNFGLGLFIACILTLNQVLNDIMNWYHILIVS